MYTTLKMWVGLSCSTLLCGHHMCVIALHPWYRGVEDAVM